MSKKSEQPNLDKTEQQRLEREARINRLKGKDGQKKKIKTSNRVKKIVAPIVVSVAVVAAIVWGSFSLGLVHRFASPMSVGDTKIGMVEYNYHYNTYLQQYNVYAQIGYAPADANGNLDLSAKTGLTDMEDMTWGEYLHQITQESMQQVVAFSETAKSKNIELSEDSKKAIDEFFASINETYKTDLERSNYFEAVYGRGANESTLRPVLERTLMANQFATELPASYDITDAEIKAHYEENTDNFDAITYRLFNFKVPTADSDATDDEKKELEEETKAKAEEMLEALTDFDSMKEVVLDFLDEDRKLYEADDLTLNVNRGYSAVGSTAVRDWLFDEDRKEGDKDIVVSGTNHYVVVFGSRELTDEVYPTVRHILFEADALKASDKELKLALEAAEKALAEITDEESMIELSEDLLESEDAAEARLYENVYRGQMVTQFENWVYDLNNEPGDTGIVQTSFGYHVMFLVSRNEEPIWLEAIDSILRSERFEEDSTALIESGDFEINLSRFGLWLAG